MEKKPKIHRKPLSRFFPAYHHKAGQPTYFVEKLWASIADCTDLVMDNIDFTGIDFDFHKYYNGRGKHHTIRAGNKVKVGDFVQFYCWSDKPYRSKQIVIAPPIEVKKVWDFEIDLLNPSKIYLNGHPIYQAGSFKLATIDSIAENDGLNLTDMLDWFKYPKPFSGQIICWNDSIEY